MTNQSNEFTIIEAAEYCGNSPHTIRAWIKHATQPLQIWHEGPLRKVKINKKVLDIYRKTLRSRGRPSSLPAYLLLIEERKQYTAKEISITYKVSKNAVWKALRIGKKEY